MDPRNKTNLATHEWIAFLSIIRIHLNTLRVSEFVSPPSLIYEPWACLTENDVIHVIFCGV
jgi:hypothetical protein